MGAGDVSGVSWLSVWFKSRSLSELSEGEGVVTVREGDAAAELYCELEIHLPSCPLLNVFQNSVLARFVRNDEILSERF
jgi:hypothetical protein